MALDNQPQLLNERNGKCNFAGMVDLVGSTMTARAVEGFWCWTVFTYGVRASKNLSDGCTRRKEGRTMDFGGCNTQV